MDSGKGGGFGDWASGEGYDVLDECKREFGEGMAVVEVQQVGFELLIGRVGVEEVGLEDHERANADGCLDRLIHTSTLVSFRRDHRPRCPSDF